MSEGSGMPEGEVPIAPQPEKPIQPAPTERVEGHEGRPARMQNPTGGTEKPFTEAPVSSEQREEPVDLKKMLVEQFGEEEANRLFPALDLLAQEDTSREQTGEPLTPEKVDALADRFNQQKIKREEAEALLNNTGFSEEEKKQILDKVTPMTEEEKAETKKEETEEEIKQEKTRAEKILDMADKVMEKIPGGRWEWVDKLADKLYEKQKELKEWILEPSPKEWAKRGGKFALVVAILGFMLLIWKMQMIGKMSGKAKG